MANKRNQAKKAKKAARDAEFVAAHAHKIEAIRSKATPQKYIAAHLTPRSAPYCELPLSACVSSSNVHGLQAS